jgi:hypothetical protein
VIVEVSFPATSERPLLSRLRKTLFETARKMAPPKVSVLQVS